MSPLVATQRHLAHRFLDITATGVGNDPVRR
jgi:hypothetical protein